MKKLLIFLVLLFICFNVFASEFPLDKSSVNKLDSLFMTNYNASLHNVGTALEIACLLTPSILAFEKVEFYPEIAIMYLETLALSWGAKELIKLVVDRPRPFMYFNDYPQAEVANGDWNDSFPSGHTTMAFSGASFTSYVFSKYNPDSKWKTPITIASYTLASLTAASRVAAGKHFLTDVIAGALLGTAIGITVPYLHTKLSNVEASLSPFGLLFSIRF